ncbi:TonB-dependent receptor [Rubrivivax gelatinosus]|uniref:Iron complex outermembrane receptor protein n=1 Tax=Rubrivivax gelatinosus TaxID=28068 RepID=A0A4R2MDL9_RUBGE|nr:TonB-dependent receptor [Rubrivivax gelatinosus]MBK1686311.1 TonB-dependent receptor [Rubrivivax gelatinosus]TCP04471.1 iron complex outermembrane receptor protein [Rubrivivax gelatinosus]
MSRDPMRRITPIAAACAALLALGAFPLAATAQYAAVTTAQPVERIEVTGSRIKRTEDEGALPVQVISREEIAKSGATTAAEVMRNLSANSGGLSDGGSINTGGYDQKGFNSANLRGIGTSSTLVLLNGRRMANFASPGDDAGVDLNSIPAAAIERIEVLLDGASAIYGTDAVSGVINFITRKDFTGAQVDVYVGDSQEGGAGKRTATITAGYGTLADNGFNVFGVFDVQRTDALSTSQRGFIKDLKIPERLPHLLSGYTSPANIRLGADQLEYLRSQGLMIGGELIDSQTINFAYGDGCNPPANLYLPDGTGGSQACTYDYMRDTELYPKSEKLSFLGRGVTEIAGGHELFAEVALARAKTWYVGSAARVTGYIDYSMVPQLAGYTGLEDIDPEIMLRMRLEEAGRRTSELTSTSQRYVVGMSGSVGDWDYEWGLNHSVNDVADRDTHGYVLYDELMQGIADGIVNPFGPSSAAGLALIDSIQVDNVVRRARGTMDAVDFSATRSFGKLAGGPVGLAVGGEFRREKSTFTPSALLMSDNINNDFAPEGGEATSDQRRVAAFYGEMQLPVTKKLELQLAARFDHYEDVGNTLNPKLGARYLVSPRMLLRGSFGTGFRAPSMTDLHRPTQYGSTSTLPDPTYCALVDNDYADCAWNWDTRRYSNPDLEPERSRQFSFGTVFNPHPLWSVSLDYWNIHKRDVISEIGDDVILANLDRYEPLVHRYNEDEGIEGCDYDPDDATICYIELRKENRGRQKASGLDVVVEMKGLQTPVGLFGARLSGTWMLESKQQTDAAAPYISNLGRFVTDSVVQRWRHRLTFDWERGAWSLSLGNTYYSSYDDQNSAINTDDGSVVAKNRVKAYSLWDLSGAYEFSKDFTLRAGVQNVFDTPPPFSNQAYYFISGYDPSYTDPRGRFFYLSARYQIR